MRLSALERGKGEPIVFVHGWCGDGSHFEAQVAAFADRHHVIIPDLPWHGSSPDEGEITIKAFADAVAEHLDRQKIHSATIVGHSMGGCVVTQLAANRPDLTRRLMILDSSLSILPTLLSGFSQLLEGLRTPNYLPSIRAVADALYHEIDDPAVRKPLHDQMTGTRQCLLVDGLRTVLDFIDGKGDRLYASLEMPVAVVSSANPFSDLARLRELRPQTIFGQVALSGHYIQIFAAEQVNAMLTQFMRLA